MNNTIHNLMKLRMAGMLSESAKQEIERTLAKLNSNERQLEETSKS